MITKGGNRMAKRNKRGMGAVRWRKDIKKYVIDFYDNLGKRHVETIGTNSMQRKISSSRR